MFDFLLSSQQFCCEGFDFFTSIIFYSMNVRILFTFTVFFVKFHALSLGLTRFQENGLVSREPKSQNAYIKIKIKINLQYFQCRSSRPIPHSPPKNVPFFSKANMLKLIKALPDFHLSFIVYSDNIHYFIIKKH